MLPLVILPQHAANWFVEMNQESAYLGIENVAVRYDQAEVLRDISLLVTRGSFVALLGSSGSGKTTLLRAICGFTPPSAGRILLAGRGKNRDAVGALVRVAAGGRTEVFPVGSSSGFLSTSGRELLVGLGGAPRIDSVDVRWPDGAEERWSDLPAAGLHTLAQGASAGH